jgi:hypothetical protein
MSRLASQSASGSRTAEDNAFQELVKRDVALLLRRVGFAAFTLADVDDIDDVYSDSGMEVMPLAPVCSMLSNFTFDANIQRGFAWPRYAKR